MKLSKIYHWQV